jgi:hypothetical protein
MPRFLIERNIPGAGALSAQELQAISQKSCSVLQGLGPQIQWVQSFVTDDKITCLYIDAELIREHARGTRCKEVRKSVYWGGCRAGAKVPRQQPGFSRTCCPELPDATGSDRLIGASDPPATAAALLRPSSPPPTFPTASAPARARWASTRSASRPCTPAPTATRTRAGWRSGMHGEMGYLSREDASRSARTRRCSSPAPGRPWWSRSNYAPRTMRFRRRGDPSRAVVARYARGDDYHELMKERLIALQEWIAPS